MWNSFFFRYEMHKKGWIWGPGHRWDPDNHSEFKCDHKLWGQRKPWVCLVLSKLCILVYLYAITPPSYLCVITPSLCLSVYNNPASLYHCMWQACLLVSLYVMTLSPCLCVCDDDTVALSICMWWWPCLFVYLCVITPPPCLSLCDNPVCLFICM